MIETTAKYKVENKVKSNEKSKVLTELVHDRVVNSYIIRWSFNHKWWVVRDSITNEIITYNKSLDFVVENMRIMGLIHESDELIMTSSNVLH